MKSHRLVALFAPLLLTLGLSTQLAASGADSSYESLYTSADSAPLDADTGVTVNLGVRFQPTVDGNVEGVEFLRGNGATSVTLYDTTTEERLASTDALTGDVGSWAFGQFAQPVHVTAGHDYTAALFVLDGTYHTRDYGFSTERTVQHLYAPAQAGRYGYASGASIPKAVWEDEEYMVSPMFVPDGSTSPSPSPTPTDTASPTPTATATATATSSPSPTTAPSPSPTDTATASPTPSPTPTDTASPTPTATATPTPSTGWPDASNTGVPAGVTLTPYDGPCSIWSDLVIDSKDVTASCGELIVYGGAHLTVTNSKVPRIESTDEANLGSVDISDSDVRAPGWLEGALWGYNITATRVDVTGGQHSVHCNDHCAITDSFLHAQYNPDGGSTHNNAFISNGGTDMLVRGNTLWCDAILNSTDGGCSGDLVLFGDFDPISHVTVEANLFKANDSSISYCTYGGSSAKPYPNASYVVYRDNVFERGPNGRCGVYGAVTDFNPASIGNEWSGNTWDDGTILNPS